MNDTKKAYRNLLAATDELVKARFVEMFGKKSFPRKKIYDVVDRNITRVGKVFSKEDSILYIDISSVDCNKKIIMGYNKYRLEDAPSRAQYILEKKDILYSTVRPNLRTFAINNYEERNIVGSTGFCVLRCKEVIPEYMIGVLLSEDFNESMVLQASGANYPAVNDKIVLDYEIAYPPRKEQEAFAQFYNDSNECKSRLNQALKTTDTMLKSYLETVMV